MENEKGYLEINNYLRYEYAFPSFWCIRSKIDECAATEYEYEGFCFDIGEISTQSEQKEKYEIKYCSDRGSGLVSFTDELPWTDSLIKQLDQKLKKNKCWNRFRKTSLITGYCNGIYDNENSVFISNSLQSVVGQISKQIFFSDRFTYGDNGKTEIFIRAGLYYKNGVGVIRPRDNRTMTMNHISVIIYDS